MEDNEMERSCFESTYLVIVFNIPTSECTGKADEDLPQTGADEDLPQTGAQTGFQNGAQTGAQTGFQNGAQTGFQNGGQTGAQNGAQTGATVEDPTAIVAKALLCFNDKYVYSSCEESYRLTESGNLNVPPEYTDQYCSGPCLTETHLLLGCIGNVLTHFEFYNKATIQDVKETLHAGCGYGPQRGNFNVAEHVQSKESGAEKITVQIIVGIVGMILGQGLLF